jgi:hypothetical protein
MLIQGQVGPSSAQSVQPGATPAVRLGQLGDTIVSELHGRYYEATYRKTMYTGVTTTGQTTSAGNAVAFTGLMLINPPTSTVNCVLNKVGLSFTTGQPAANVAIGLQTGTTAAPGIVTYSTTSTQTKSTFIGAPAGQAFVAASATIPTGANVAAIFGTVVQNTTTSPGFFADLEGSIIVPPGAFVATYSNAASGTNALFASFQWEEVPL